MSRNWFRTNQIRKSVFGREMRKPIVDSIVKTQDFTDERMDKEETIHNERVATVGTTPISGRDGYYTISFTRANRE